MQAKRIILEENFPASELEGFADFIEKHFLALNLRVFENRNYRKRTNNDEIEFSWILRVPKHRGIEPLEYSLLPVTFTLGPNSIGLEAPSIDLSDRAVLDLYSKLTAELQNMTWEYLNHIKLTSLYFVIGGNPEEKSTQQHPALRKIFVGNNTNLFLITMLLSFVFFFAFGLYTPIILVAMQFPLVLFSDKIMLQSGEVKPNEQFPLVTVISVRTNEETLRSLGGSLKSIIEKAKVEIRRDNLESRYDLDRASAKSRIRKILNENGIPCTEDEIEIETKNIHRIVQDAALRFKMAAPKIVMVETPVSNAAATGISKRRSSIMITAGSFEDLSDDELEAVIGHEFGHVRGRDPLILFSVTSFEFLGRFYLWLPLLLYFGFIYLIFAFGLIFFFGKFLETRADTFSANEIGTPSLLASSLTKIGYRQLFYENYSSRAKILDWLKFDPHPPIYFRVRRLSRMDRVILHPFLNAVRDCVSGFFSALMGR